MIKTILIWLLLKDEDNFFMKHNYILFCFKYLVSVWSWQTEVKFSKYAYNENLNASFLDHFICSGLKKTHIFKMYTVISIGLKGKKEHSLLYALKQWAKIFKKERGDSVWNSRLRDPEETLAYSNQRRHSSHLGRLYTYRSYMCKFEEWFNWQLFLCFGVIKHTPLSMMIFVECSHVMTQETIENVDMTLIFGSLVDLPVESRSSQHCLIWALFSNY